MSFQEDRAVRPLPRQHQGDDPAGEQEAGVPCGGRGPLARQRRRRARGSEAVLCVGYASDAVVGDWGERGRAVCCTLMGKKQDFVETPLTHLCYPQRSAHAGLRARSSDRPRRQFNAKWSCNRGRLPACGQKARRDPVA